MRKRERATKCKNSCGVTNHVSLKKRYELRDLKLEQFFQAHSMKVFLVQADILREKNLCF